MVHKSMNSMGSMSSIWRLVLWSLFRSLVALQCLSVLPLPRFLVPGMPSTTTPNTSPLVLVAVVGPVPVDAFQLSPRTPFPRAPVLLHSLSSYRAESSSPSSDMTPATTTTSVSSSSSSSSSSSCSSSGATSMAVSGGWARARYIPPYSVTRSPSSIASSSSSTALYERKCDLTGRRQNSGCMAVSKSGHRTHRSQGVNLHTKVYWWPEGRTNVRVRVAARTMKTIALKGISRVARENGVGLNAFRISTKTPALMFSNVSAHYREQYRAAKLERQQQQLASRSIDAVAAPSGVDASTAATSTATSTGTGGVDALLTSSLMTSGGSALGTDNEAATAKTPSGKKVSKAKEKAKAKAKSKEKEKSSGSGSGGKDKKKASGGDSSKAKRKS